MKTSIQVPLPARRPRTVRDVAPALVSRGRKIRANVDLPTPRREREAGGLPPHEQAVIDAAMAILRNRLATPGGYAVNTRSARRLAMLHFMGFERECFAVMYLDARHGLIAFEEITRGTLMRMEVYPREVARAALRHNAAAVILTHNHPTGVPKPSDNDVALTKTLRMVLALVDVYVLDHLIVAGGQAASMVDLHLI